MSDNCGAISLTQVGNLDFGSSTGTDCTTPGFGGAGNTHSSRTGFYELNKLKEMARGQLPSNAWLTQQLTANMNISLTCNAFWNGSTVNFYRSGGGCFNTGEIAAVFDHEWGHGLDDNDINGAIASPSGEGIADIYSALRLNDSCIGRGFRATPCNNNGDACITCTGVRDIDYLKRVSGTPHHYTWSNANCAGSVHCVGGVYAEALWSLWKRKLVSAPYSLEVNTAHEVATRLSYIAGGNITTWFSGGPPNGGRAAGSGYLNYLAADDDNGNLNDGTPHMTAIYQSFNDQQIACATPTVQDSGCARHPDRGAQRDRHRRQQHRRPRLDRGGERHQIPGLPHRRRGRLRLRQGQAGRNRQPQLERFGSPERPALQLRGDPDRRRQRLPRPGVGLRHRDPGRRAAGARFRRFLLARQPHDAAGRFRQLDLHRDRARRLHRHRRPLLLGRARPASAAASPRRRSARPAAAP